MGSIVVEAHEIDPTVRRYYILVVCRTICRYGVTVSYTEEVTLDDGQLHEDTVDVDRMKIYKFVTPSDPVDSLEFTVSPKQGEVQLFVAEDPEEPGPDNTKPIQATFTGGRTCIFKPRVSKLYRAAVTATNSTTPFTITVATSNGVTELQGAKPIHGAVVLNHMRLYKFWVPKTETPLEI
jgi:hypothetical protein